MWGDDKTVIIVDDDFAVLRRLGEILISGGFAVHLADSVAAALEQIRQHPAAHVMLTDVGLPIIDGIKLADMVKVRYPNLEIVYMTDHAVKVQTEPGLWYGPTLTKPIDAAELVAIVEQSCACRPQGRRPRHSREYRLPRHGFRSTAPRPIAIGREMR
jgi:two-component system response regulator FlrC